MSDKFAYKAMKPPKLSKEAVVRIKWWMDWEDNSWRNVMGTEPPWLKHPQETETP